MKAFVLFALAGLGLGAPKLALAQYGGQSAPPGQYGGYGQQQYPGTPGGQQGQQQGLSSGGLAPPAPMAEDPESAATEEKLEKADEKDSGRGLEWVYLNAEVGMQHLGLQTFKAAHLVDAKVVNSTQTGLLYGAGAGVRLVFLTLGARFRMGSFSDYSLWTLDGELGLRIPLGSVEPYFVVGGGYASLGAFSAQALSANIDVHGYNIRAGGGLDIYVTPVFSIGGNVTGDLVGLTRPGVSPATLSKIQGNAQANPQGSAAQIYGADGSAMGAGLTVTAVLGLHF